MDTRLEDQLLDTNQAAEFLGYSVATLQWWRTTSPKRGPRFYKTGRLVRYRQSDLTSWFESCAVEPEV